ncbi:MAG: tyrosine-type recombinase/integrase [Parafannyhessea sp.]|uniref:tyrosine-type recombinase/integrase n=1 Tax=Parafannyhessea sp. TaxID=2847324 RepID=UPI003F0325BE
MAKAVSTRRTGRPVQLKPGMSTVESAKVVELADGRYRMQWYVCLPTGRVVHKKIERRAKRKADIRDRARELTEELLRTGGEWGLAGWKGSSDMGRFVEEVCVRAVEANCFAKPLRPHTQERYVHDLRLFAERARGMTIAAASRPKALVPIFQLIAREHGTATARKASTTCSKYVFKRLVTYQVIDHNPLVGIDLELPQVTGKAHGKEHVKGGQSLTAEERKCVVAWLAAWQPEAKASEYKNVAGRYGIAGTQARWELARDVTLVQATCGLRLNEALSMERRDVEKLDGHMCLTVREEVSKTHKARTVPVTDKRASEAVRRRLKDTVGPEPTSLVFGSPAAPQKPWDRSNAHKTLRKLYDMMADELSIPKLREVSTHSWRDTLNTEWMEQGVPVEIRHEFFGHSKEENVSTYTDVTHTRALLDMLDA